MFYKNALRQTIEHSMDVLFSDVQESSFMENYAVARFFFKKKIQYKSLDTQVLKVKCKLRVLRICTILEETVVEYVLFYTFLLKKESCIYQEEGQFCHCAVFTKGILIKDASMEREGHLEEQLLLIDCFNYEDINFSKQPEKIQHMREPNQQRGGYDALAAVKYAERYWNDHHFAYPVFANDCTNFISQCLYAGGAKMHGESRTSGWWIRNGSWSYSWTTAHALYLYLKHAKSGLRGVFVSDPRELLLGDIICYDFEGDGRFNHTTIVVNKNAEGEPFVNAHTTNSRQRFWSYTDSTAYTPNIQYAWIQIHI